LLVALLALDASVDDLSRNVASVRTEILDKTREAQDLQQSALDELRQDYEGHIQDIRTQVKERLQRVEERNAQALGSLQSALAALDSTVQECDRLAKKIQEDRRRDVSP
jgi:DNA anti-recombination protein RmuC